LVVDDNDLFRQMIKIMLESRGYSVLEASDGQIALELIERKPDCVLLDVNMPVKDGLETMDACIEIKRDIPIILCTVYPEYYGLLRAFSAAAKIKNKSNLDEIVLAVDRIIQTKYLKPLLCDEQFCHGF
jgi:CheY-like chemotaxis protein